MHKEGNKMDTKARIKNLSLTILIVVVCLTLYKLFGKQIFGLFENTYIGYCAAQSFFAALGIGAAVILNRKDIFRADWSKLKGNWACASLLFAMIAFYFALGLGKLLTSTATWWEMIIFVVYSILVGLCEEIIFRGLIQGAMHKFFGEKNKRSVVLAIILSGLFFGATHLANLTQPGTSFKAVIVQVVIVSAMGVYLGAIYYRTGKNLWYLAIIHGVYDMCGLIIDGTLNGVPIVAAGGSPAGGALISILIWVLVYAVATLIILRPKKLRACIPGMSCDLTGSGYSGGGSLPMCGARNNLQGSNPSCP